MKIKLLFLNKEFEAQENSKCFIRTKYFKKEV